MLRLTQYSSESPLVLQNTTQLPMIANALPVTLSSKALNLSSIGKLIPFSGSPLPKLSIKICYSNHSIYSEFCGYPQCKMCIVKQRPFPVSSDERRSRGECCKVCDRKFYIREIVKGNMDQIKVQSVLLAALQRQVLDKETECNDLDNNYNYYLKQIKGENGQVKQTKTDIKK